MCERFTVGSRTYKSTCVGQAQAHDGPGRYRADTSELHLRGHRQLRLQHTSTGEFGTECEEEASKMELPIGHRPQHRPPPIPPLRRLLSSPARGPHGLQFCRQEVAHGFHVRPLLSSLLVSVRARGRTRDQRLGRHQRGVVRERAWEQSVAGAISQVSGRWDGERMKALGGALSGMYAHRGPSKCCNPQVQHRDFLCSRRDCSLTPPLSPSLPVLSSSSLLSSPRHHHGFSCRARWAARWRTRARSGARILA